MVESHHVFNFVVYALVIAYILYINFASYYNKGTEFVSFFVNLFQNWIFRLIFLVIVGYFSMDFFKFGGFTFAVLLTIAFLNTNMLVGRSGMEGFDDDDVARDDYDDGDDFTNKQKKQEKKHEMKREKKHEMKHAEDQMESFDVNTMQSGDNCGPYANLQRLPFNPQGFRPNDSALGSGAPDALPMDSLANGPYTDSGVGYEFHMA